MSPIHQLSFSLYSGSRLIIQLVQNSLKEIGLTYPQFLVLAVLWEEDGLKVNEIGSKLYLDSGTLTPLLKKLESMNYVKRVRSELDERTVNIELTYPGKSLQKKAEDSLSIVNSLFKGGTELDVEMLNHSLQHLLESIEELKKKN